MDSYREKLESSQIELAKLKQNFQTQDLTFRVIQGELYSSFFSLFEFRSKFYHSERLVFTTNEAERYKSLAQNKIGQLSKFCATFLREASADFELENDFEKSLDVLETEKAKKELQSELDELRNENSSLSKRIDAIVTCPICEEKFESRTVFHCVPLYLNISFENLSKWRANSIKTQMQSYCMPSMCAGKYKLFRARNSAVFE